MLHLYYSKKPLRFSILSKGKEEAAEENNTTGNPVNFFMWSITTQYTKSIPIAANFMPILGFGYTMLEIR